MARQGSGGISLSPEYPKLEAETREDVAAKLEAAGWMIQDKKRINLYEKLGVAGALNDKI